MVGPLEYSVEIDTLCLPEHGSVVPIEAWFYDEIAQKRPRHLVQFTKPITQGRSK
jgi:hypothetical protein